MSLNPLQKSRRTLVHLSRFLSTLPSLGIFRVKPEPWSVLFPGMQGTTGLKVLLDDREKVEALVGGLFEMPDVIEEVNEGVGWVQTTKL